MNCNQNFGPQPSNTRIIKETLPLLLSAKEAPQVGISRSAYYRLTHREGVPIVIIGERRYIHRDLFFEWLEQNVGTTL